MAPPTVASSPDRTRQSLFQQTLNSGVPREELVLISLQAGRSDQQEWAPEFQREDLAAAQEDTKLCIGSQVILSGGTGRKRKFNDCLAQVTEYPETGAWMRTVGHDVNHLQTDDQQEHHQVKSRKGGFRSTARSLLLEVGDDILGQIFDFVGCQNDVLAPIPCSDDYRDSLNTHQRVRIGPTDGLLWLQYAVAMPYKNIASTCRLLRQFCFDYLGRRLGLLDADFSGIEGKNVVSALLWLCRYKCKLGTFKLTAERADIPLLCKLLRECDTTALWKLEGCLFNIDVDKCSRFISLAWSEKMGQNGLLLEDLSGDQGEQTPSLEKMAFDLAIPFRNHADPKDWHDTIAAECPNLKQLKINCVMPCAEATESWKQVHFSQELFSVPSLEKLDIRFSGSQEEDMNRESFNGNFIRPYINSLPSLTDLAIGFENLDDHEAINNMFYIESDILQFLHVKRLGNANWVSCKCPRLERFDCDGDSFGNGTRPDWTLEQSLAYRGGDVMRAGTTPMIGLEVPDTCECFLHGFQNSWSDFFLGPSA